MPISSGALGWPRSYWTPPKKVPSTRRVYPVSEWARRRAEEIKQKKLAKRRQRNNPEHQVYKYILFLTFHL